MARCFLGVWENACGCLGAFCGWAWLKAFWEAAETHVAVEGGHGLSAFWEAVKKQVAGWALGALGCCRSAVVVHWAWLTGRL